ncbi:MAG: hypothetical protein ACXV76_09425, partial [Halobacteriota archaeon]
MDERVHLYNEDVKRSLEEMAPVSKPSKFALVMFGNATYWGENAYICPAHTRHATEVACGLRRGQTSSFWPFQRDAKGKSFNLRKGWRVHLKSGSRAHASSYRVPVAGGRIHPVA